MMAKKNHHTLKGAVVEPYATKCSHPTRNAPESTKELIGCIDGL
jgi:hypothetical protein